MSVRLLDNDLIAIKDFNGDLTDLANLVATISPNYVNNYYNKVYTFFCSLLFEDNCVLKDSRKSILVLGDHFLFENNTLIEFGTGSYNTSTGKYKGYSGCEISMPNLVRFGSLTDNAGKFKAYNSIMDVFCYWYIIGSSASLSLVETDITGYGVYEGNNSVLYKVRYLKSSASNGVLRPTNSNGVYESIEVNGDVILDQLDTGASAIVIDSYSGDMIWEYGTIDNYSNLIKILDNGSYTGTISLLGTEVLNGYGVDGSDNQHNIYHKFKFSGILYDSNGSLLPNYKMTILNKQGEIEQSFMTNEFGHFDRWITYYQDLAGTENTGEYMTPHTVVIDDRYSIRINATRNMINVPLFLNDAGTQDNSEIRVLIEELKNILVTSDQGNKEYLSTLTIALSDKINNVTTSVFRSGNVTIKI